MPSNPPYSSASNPTGADAARSVQANPFDTDRDDVLDHAATADEVPATGVTGLDEEDCPIAKRVNGVVPESQLPPGYATIWRNGSGVPSDALGVDDDYYLNNDTGDVYKRSGGAYAVVANIKGAAGVGGSAGTVWRYGSGAPSNGLGVNGDYYVDFSSAEYVIYYKQ